VDSISTPASILSSTKLLCRRSAAAIHGRCAVSHSLPKEVLGLHCEELSVLLLSLLLLLLLV
jgi:hypothetical protein